MAALVVCLVLFLAMTDHSSKFPWIFFYFFCFFKMVFFSYSVHSPCSSVISIVDLQPISSFFFSFSMCFFECLFDLFFFFFFKLLWIVLTFPFNKLPTF